MGMRRWRVSDNARANPYHSSPFKTGESSMPVEVTMPQLSDTMSEGTVVKWHKKEGDKVKAGEEIADVETDKATMPMEAFEGGTLAAIVVPEGGKVNVGDTIAVLATAKENAADVKKQFAGGGAKSGPAAKQQPAEEPAAQKAAPAAAAATPSRQAASSNRVPPQASQGGSVAMLEEASASEVH